MTTRIVTYSTLSIFDSPYTETLLTLYKEFSNEEQRYYPPHLRTVWSDDLTLGRLIAGSTHVLLAIEKETVIGFAVVCVETPQGEEPAKYLYSLFVVKSKRRKGIGLMLLNVVKQLLPVSEIVLSVLPKNKAAVAFYEKSQFETLYLRLIHKPI